MKGGKLSNLHEYQDAWGYWRTVESQAKKLSQSKEPDAAGAAQKILE